MSAVGSALSLRGVRKSHPVQPGAARGAELLRGVDLEVPRGEFLAIEGQSGSGKSSLLHLLGGLDHVYEGELSVLGQELRSLGDEALAALRNQSIGFVFQAFNLLPALSALDNVLLPEAFGDVPHARARAQEALDRVGLSAKQTSLPSQLSGGERQRVAIARALFMRPPLLLADEPIGNLDAQTGGGVIELFGQLHRDGMTVLVVTHEARMSRAAQRVLSLHEGQLFAQPIDRRRTRDEDLR